MKKIVLVSTLPPVHTSLSEYGQFLVNGLLSVSDKVEIHVLADIALDSFAPIQEMEDARLSVSRSWRFNALNTPFKLMAELRKLKPDVVIFNLQVASFGNKKIPAMLGLTMPMIARRMGFKVITVLHNMIDAMDLDEPYFAQNKLDRFLIQAGGMVATRLLLQSNNLVVTLDKYKDILEDKYRAKNVEVIGLGSYIKPADHSYHQDKNHFLTFGKFGTYKKLEFLLDAFGAISQDHPEIKLVIGGADHPNTPGYMKAIEARYRHLSNVSFIGWIEDEDLPQRIREAKALILSYESTAGSSGPLHLATSQGKVVIAPRLGDFIHVADTEGVDILFYEPDDITDFKQLWVQVIQNQIDLRQMEVQNLELARQDSAWNTAFKYLKLVNRQLNYMLPISQHGTDNLRLPPSQQGPLSPLEAPSSK